MVCNFGDLGSLFSSSNEVKHDKIMAMLCEITKLHLFRSGVRTVIIRVQFKTLSMVLETLHLQRAMRFDLRPIV